MATTQLKSERIVTQSAMSISGAVRRTQRDLRIIGGLAKTWPGAARVAWGVVAVAASIVDGVLRLAYAIVMTFGLLLLTFPLRLMGRGHRKRKLAKIRHRETLEAVSQGNATSSTAERPNDTSHRA